MNEKKMSWEEKLKITAGVLLISSSSLVITLFFFFGTHWTFGPMGDQGKMMIIILSFFVYLTIAFLSSIPIVKWLKLNN